MKFGASCLPWIAAVMAVAASGSGCSVLNTCDMTNDDAQVYTGGTTVGGYYMSSAWEGPLLAFPAGKRYDLVHGLGCAPRDVEIFVSFSEQGAASGSNIAPSAGNMSIVELVDGEKLRVKNDTCSDMYVLVTASGPDCSAAPDEADAAAGDAIAEDGM